ncbi:MAG: ABC transporter ATP-binding protein [Acidimicrobiia bacterium]|nr:ABC transporter ATP-binding protein [Acidimicrobiia bacterium]NNC42729.1 ABC transporter ATP-binding protein [Acidimicrobiia bacterium]NND12471.1 ABC transporter ATP-binding protein [Acidimicrobiia bacterium]NNL26956.1 ABC transporter ATP-binding protein [Acidimicrobiia bacterium]
MTLQAPTGVAVGPGHPVVELIDVSRVFDTTPPVHALRDVNLAIADGEYVSISGPSGSGKSTLLNLLGLLDRPTSGTYLLDGIDTSDLGDRRRASVRGQRIGFVFQAFHLLNTRTVLDNVVVGQIYNRIPRNERKPRAIAALERVGLAHRIDFRPDRLSGGERQRVAIARAIAHSPSLLLCDEPTGNLDSATTEAIMALFEDLHRVDGLTLVVITHDEAVSARAPRTVNIIDGLLTESA